MEPLKLYSSRALFGIDIHSGSVYPHSGCLCYEGMEGGTVLKLILQKLVMAYQIVVVSVVRGWCAN